MWVVVTFMENKFRVFLGQDSYTTLKLAQILINSNDAILYWKKFFLNVMHTFSKGTKKCYHFTWPSWVTFACFCFSQSGVSIVEFSEATFSIDTQTSVGRVLLHSQVLTCLALVFVISLLPGVSFSALLSRICHNVPFEKRIRKRLRSIHQNEKNVQIKHHI